MSELPKGWVSTTLKELFEVKYGKGLPDRLRDSSGKVPVYGSNGVVGRHSEALTVGSTILIGRKGSAGEVHLSDKPCWAIDTTYYIDDFHKVLPPKYWFYFLRSLRLGQHDQSSAIPSVRREEIYTVHVPVPPLNEQKRIVARLDELLPKVEACKQRLEKIPTILKRFRQSVLAAAVSGKLTEDWRRAQSDKAEFPPLNWVSKPDWAEDFPDTWKYCRVGDVVEWIEAGKNFTCSGEPVKSGAVGLVKISAVTWDEFNSAATKTVTDPKYINPSLFIKEGDLLVSRANTRELLGSSVIVRRINHKIMISDKVWRLHLKDFSKGFFHLFLKSFLGRNQLEAAATGNQTAMFNISQKSFSEMIIPFPPLPEQEVIYSRADALIVTDNELRIKVESASAVVAKTADSILARAFSGFLVDQDHTDEPASLLLERIKSSAPSPKQKTAPARRRKAEKEPQSLSA